MSELTKRLIICCVTAIVIVAFISTAITVRDSLISYHRTSLMGDCIMFKTADDCRFMAYGERTNGDTKSE